MEKTGKASEHKEQTKLNRRKFLRIGIGAGLTTAIATPLIYYRKELLNIWEDSLQLEKVDKLVEEAKSVAKEIELLQEEIQINWKSIVTSPESYTQKVEEIRVKIKELSALLKEVKATGFRINSGLVYRQRKHINREIAGFSSGPFAVLNTLAQKSVKAKQYANQLRQRITTGLKRMTNNSGEVVGQSINYLDQEMRNGINSATQFSIAGLEIDLIEIAQLILTVDKLVKALLKLDESIDGLTSRSVVEFSNNDTLNAFYESPGKITAMDIIAILSCEHHITKGNSTEKEYNVSNEFFDRYDIYPSVPTDEDGEIEWNSAHKLILENRLKQFEHHLDSFNTAIEKYDKTGSTIHGGTGFKQIQEILAMGGYLDYEEIDGSVGKYSSKAFKKLEADVKDVIKNISKFRSKKASFIEVITWSFRMASTSDILQKMESGKLE